MTPKLNISGRNLDKQVKYTPFKTDSRLFIEKEIKDVIKENHTVFNRLGIYVSSLGLGMIPNIVQAQEVVEPATDILNPQTMFEWSIRIALVGLGTSMGATILLLMAAATVKQLGGERNRKKSKEWNTDIIKGFVQVLVAIPVVFALYYLATTIFGQIDFSKSTLIEFP